MTTTTNTCAAPAQVEIQTTKGNRTTNRTRDFGSVALAAQWARANGWTATPDSYILHNAAKPNQTAIINRLLDFNGIQAYKARHGSLNAMELQRVFKAI